ncbi:hypothetical protein [Helicobacter sp. 11S02596-1]|uniref:hypothetical protein n=1 Tax=Helicobacter sp. 11S02596-1 TaxID=1476194 RepID=UPI000BA5C4F1|nr:hypothetical protein [Helicobacter sp. 11S02596-1]PAF44757.1 hypothetical protein BJI48_01860 [Helicobacter sp. 11S02596-1]
MKQSSSKATNTKYTYIAKQPLDIPLGSFLNQHFYLYEIADNFKILQKKKIPKAIFEDFIQNSPRWEFKNFMAFRLNDKDIKFFKSNIGFSQINPYSCVDIFTSCAYVNVRIDKGKVFSIKKRRQDIIKLYKNIVPCEFFPECRTQKRELKIISSIIKKDGFRKIYFINNKLNLFLYKDDFNCNILSLSDCVYQYLLKKFKYFYTPTEDELGYIFKSLPKKFPATDYKRISMGYDVPTKPKDFKLVLQYRHHFEIFTPTLSQAQKIQEYFYKPLPNNNLFLGILKLSNNEFIIPCPKIYCNIYDKDYILIDLFFLPDNFKLHQLVDIIGIIKFKKIISLDKTINLSKKEFSLLLNYINIYFIKGQYYELGISY